MSTQYLDTTSPIVTSVNEQVGDVDINMDNLGITEELAKKSDVGHKHKYAGSSESGGVATSAEKLTGNSKMKNKGGSADSWWERSPKSSNTGSFGRVSGGVAGSTSATSVIRVAFGFCV